MEKNKKITLDSLMQDSANQPSLKSSVSSNEVVQSVQEEINQLSVEDRQEIDRIKEDLDVRNTNELTNFGIEAQRNIAKFSSEVLETIRVKDTDEVGDKLTSLVLQIKEVNFDDQAGFFSRLLHRGKSQIQRITMQFDSVKDTINKLEAELLVSQKNLQKDIAMMDKLYDENVSYFQKLQHYIIAGEEIIKEMNEEIIPQLQKEAQQSHDDMAIQVVHDFSESVNRFDKKIDDLRRSKTVAIQTAPQIKLIQNNDRMLVERITNTVNTTLPTWNAQVLIALGLQNQRQALEQDKLITEATNEMMKENADKLHQATVDTTRLVNQASIDVETLKHVNAELMDTINESININNQAKEARQQAAVEIAQIEAELKEALIRATQPSQVDSRRVDVTP